MDRDGAVKRRERARARRRSNKRTEANASDRGASAQWSAEDAALEEKHEAEREHAELQRPGYGNLLYGVLFIVGGLSGTAALKGTGSPLLLALVGFGLLAYGIHQHRRYGEQLRLREAAADRLPEFEPESEPTPKQRSRRQRGKERRERARRRREARALQRAR